MTKFKAYPFQIEVSEQILAGKSVILQAPTGSGKTRAALLPFLHAHKNLAPNQFPRKCIYSIPMRALANQFTHEYKNLIIRRDYEQNLDVRIQTGDHPDDPKFESDLIFTTIDQTLSSFLGIPYSLSNRLSNLNVGAIASSYLVFDEFHLFPPQALATTLQMLKMLKGITPFLLMTATFSGTMLDNLSKQLDAVVITQNTATHNGKIDFQSLPSQEKERFYHTVDHTINTADVLAQHPTTPKARSIAICNTVQRAQDLYTALKDTADENIEIKLLHSRFYKKDREAKENWLRREFGKNKNEYTTDSAILVATQVVEVGLDITSDALHTELAPANAVLQRAGRCARYRGERGEVFIYRLPEKEDKNGEMKPQYAPYHTGGQKELCEKTWTAFLAQNGKRLTFVEEQALLSEVHRVADEKTLQDLQDGRNAHRRDMEHAMAFQERGLASDLIRDVNNRNIIVHPDPRTDTDPKDPAKLNSPWRWQNFSLFAGTVAGAFNRLQILAEEIGHDDWTMMRLNLLPSEGTEEWEKKEEAYAWKPIHDKSELTGALLVAVHPHFAKYSPETGFELGVQNDEDWTVKKRKAPKRDDPRYTYQRETYLEHIAGLHTAYQQKWHDEKGEVWRQALKDDMAYTFAHYETLNNLPVGMMDALARFIIAGHDLGKLGTGWQSWTHNWQKLPQIDNLAPVDEMLAHTDYDGSDAQWKLQKTFNKKQGQRPPHAAESAYALRMPTFFITNKNRDLTRAALTAIARHHTATHSGKVATFASDAHALPAFRKAFEHVGMDIKLLDNIQWTFEDDADLTNALVESDKITRQLIPYFLLARVLRLADQRSQQ